MSATIPTRQASATRDASTVPVDRTDAQLRDAAVASLKRKRAFVQDAYGYVSINGVLWLIWALTDRSMDGSIPWPAWVSLIWGFLLAVDAWRAFGNWPRSLHEPITEADIERELNRTRSA
jgi:hypothetical protein